MFLFNSILFSIGLQTATARARTRARTRARARATATATAGGGRGDCLKGNRCSFFLMMVIAVDRSILVAAVAVVVAVVSAIWVVAV